MTRSCFRCGGEYVEKERAALENVPPNLYESVCVPDLSDFLGASYHHSMDKTGAANSSAAPPSPSPSHPAAAPPPNTGPAYLQDAVELNTTSALANYATEVGPRRIQS
uniref:Uncharacterized protein n=1 Tax=Timema douglasi TaxID=61478 RepID=A0A7R8VFY9_TIMDO|nr:unnamed protein product [Timema douglasi]